MKQAEQLLTLLMLMIAFSTTALAQYYSPTPIRTPYIQPTPSPDLSDIPEWEAPSESITPYPELTPNPDSSEAPSTDPEWEVPPGGDGGWEPTPEPPAPAPVVPEPPSPAPVVPEPPAPEPVLPESSPVRTCDPGQETGWRYLPGGWVGKEGEKRDRTIKTLVDASKDNYYETLAEKEEGNINETKYELQVCTLVTGENQVETMSWVPEIITINRTGDTTGTSKRGIDFDRNYSYSSTERFENGKTDNFEDDLIVITSEGFPAYLFATPITETVHHVKNLNSFGPNGSSSYRFGQSTDRYERSTFSSRGTIRTPLSSSYGYSHKLRWLQNNGTRTNLDESFGRTVSGELSEGIFVNDVRRNVLGITFLRHDLVNNQVRKFVIQWDPNNDTGAAIDAWALTENSIKTGGAYEARRLLNEAYNVEEMIKGFFQGPTNQIPKMMDFAYNEFKDSPSQFPK